MKASLLYTLAGTFILTWWTLAFYPSTSTELNIKQADPLDHSPLLTYLSPLDRDSLKQALSGDSKLMIEMIDQWELDADTLTEKGFQKIQRLSLDDLLAAHLLIQQQQVQTDHRILPQTDMAASFLLAISPPKEIVALPKGIHHSPLFDAQLTAQIPLIAPHLSSEQLYSLKPTLALISLYTHPGTKEMLNRLAIPLSMAPNIESIEQIHQALLKVGTISLHSGKAQLLSIFMRAALLHIDHRLSALANDLKIKNVLYLVYHHHFMIPTTQSLAGQLMQRAAEQAHLSCPLPTHGSNWRLPFEQEKILESHAECLLIASQSPRFHQVVKELPASKMKHLYYLDEYVQDSPTQYIVLAYYDIFNALAATIL